jgi:hypothetical protein
MTTEFPPLVQSRRLPASREAAAQLDVGLAGERVCPGDSRPSVAWNAVGVVTSG